MNIYGFDEARKMEVYHKNISLQYFEEAYTTTNWYLRIFKVIIYLNKFFALFLLPLKISTFSKKFYISILFIH